MQTAHVNQKDLKPNDYLDEEIEFTNDEKAYYFDDLQTKYAELKSKVDFFEKRYEILKLSDQNIADADQDNKDPSHNHNLSSKVKRQKRDFDEYSKDGSSDPFLPEGWRSGSMQGFAQSIFNVFEAPDGKFCAGRRLAIVHAKNVLKSPESDILLMRKGLIVQDGWTLSDKLPEKWLFRDHNSKGKRSLSFLNQEYDLLSSGVKALQDLVKKDYSDGQINIFINTFIDQTIDPEEITWEKESIIPKPWKIGKTFSRGLYVTPSGRLFRIKKMFLKFVKKSRDINLNTKSIILTYVRKELKKKNFIKQDKDKGEKVESNGQWVTTECLPSGWMFKDYYESARSRKYLSPDSKVMNFDRAIIQMKREGVAYSDILKFKKGRGWEEHEDLPKGWLHALRYNYGNFHYRSFLSPDGKAINGIPMLLKHFKSLDYVDQKDMEKIKNIIEQDGWKGINGIPDGWYFKEKIWTIKSESAVKKYFLSDKGDRLKSPIDTLKYLLANNYPQNSIDEFRKTFKPRFGKKAEDTLKNNLNLKDEMKEKITKDAKPMKIRPEPKKIPKKVDNKIETIKFVEKHYLPQGWTTNGRYYRSSDGQTLKTLHEKVKAMKSKGYSETEIDQVKMYGSQIPFMKKSNLPDGWMVAFIRSGEKLNGGAQVQSRYLSQEGQIFMNRASTIKFMLENNYPKNDIEVMKSLLISEDKWEIDPILPNGWMTKQNKRSGVVFLAPSWEILNYKVGVLEFMKKHDYNDAVIEAAKKYLYENPKFMFSQKRIKTEPDNEDEELKPPKKKAHLDSEVIEWKSGDSGVPENWLIARKSDNSILISTPKGEKFRSRIEAIASMIRNQQSPEDMFKMWRNLHLEGWVCDEAHLPSGWRRKYLDDLETYNYLSPLMVVIRTPTALLTHMESSQQYTSEDIVKVNMWINSL